MLGISEVKLLFLSIVILLNNIYCVKFYPTNLFSIMFQLQKIDTLETYVHSSTNLVVVIIILIIHHNSYHYALQLPPQESSYYYRRYRTYVKVVCGG
ncbi:hypothetical protein NIES4103_31660 [Nostoc sp. NIES-4103]|nr:hypothetical protein NIES4103_31660 [Nostoc sp. NIES-4103]